MADPNATEKLSTTDPNATEKLSAAGVAAPGPGAGAPGTDEPEVTASVPAAPVAADPNATAKLDVTAEPVATATLRTGSASRDLQPSGEPAEDADEDGRDEEAPAKKKGRRRRGRTWLVVGVFLLVLVMVLAGAAVVAERYVRQQVVEAVLGAVPGLSDDAVVTTEGLVLPQVLSGRLDTLEVDADALLIETGLAPADSGMGAITSFELTNLEADLNGVEVSSPYTVDSLEVTASLGFDELSSLMAAAEPGFPRLTLTPETYGSSTAPGTMSAQTTVLYMDAALTVEPEVTADGGLKVTVTSVSIHGAELDLEAEFFGGTLLSHLGMDTPEITIGSGALPSGLKISQAHVARDGLRLTLTGSNVDLASM